MMGLIPETLARVSLTMQYPKLGGINMKQTINLNDFRNAFQSIRPNNFSYEGLEVLFDYCEDLEVSCNEEMELDVIALCCDYAESSFEELIHQYDIDVKGVAEVEEFVLDFMNDRTIVLGVGDTPKNSFYSCSIVYQQF
jgi:Ca2+-binding EF-hand superfamily protein